MNQITLTEEQLDSMSYTELAFVESKGLKFLESSYVNFLSKNNIFSLWAQWCERDQIQIDFDPNAYFRTYIILSCCLEGHPEETKYGYFISSLAEEFGSLSRFEVRQGWLSESISSLIASIFCPNFH